MKKTELNKVIRETAEKFGVSVPKASDINFIKRSNELRFAIDGALPVVFLNSLGRSLKVQPKNIKVEAIGDHTEVFMPLAA